MRYIEPWAVIRNRLSDELIPKWEAAVLCFRDHKGSQELVRVFSAKPVGYKVLFGMQKSEECPYVYEATIGINPSELLPGVTGEDLKQQYLLKNLLTLVSNMQLGMERLVV